MQDPLKDRTVWNEQRVRMHCKANLEMADALSKAVEAGCTKEMLPEMPTEHNENQWWASHYILLNSTYIIMMV